jgi:aspartyl-tRNA(Asn)/glutamyl-tRNA(Gln) amidotransferase subunit A
VNRAALAVADEVVAAAVEQALAALEAAGWALVDVTLPDRARVQEVTTTVMFFEAAAVHRTLWSQHPDRLGADVLARLRRGADIPEPDYRAALDDAAVLRDELAGTLAGVEAIVEPTVPIVAPTIVDARVDQTLPAILVSNTRLANVTGTPALSLPIPSATLPVGLQVMAPTDATALAVAQTLSGQLPHP